MFRNIFILTLAVHNAVLTENTDGQCRIRNYGMDHIVCVCTSEHCDTISRPKKLQQSQYLIYTSSKDGLRFKPELGIFKKSSSTDKNKIIINPYVKYQKIVGWGGAFTDSTGYNINQLDKKTQDVLLRSYFGEDGIEYNLGRVPMAGTDFSIRSYTYDDGDTDLQLKRFKLQREDYLFKIPYIKKAQNLTNDNLWLFSSVWASPDWMTTQLYCFIADIFYQSWADYFIKFLNAYLDNGIDFWVVITGNEPSLGFSPINPMKVPAWTPPQLAKFVGDYLGPTLQTSKHNKTKLMILDDQRYFLNWYLQSTLQNATVAAYVYGFALHWYTNKIFPPKLMTETHNLWPNKIMLSTEASQGISPDIHVDLGSWERGELYAIDIIEFVSHWGVGWVDWNMVLDLNGGPNHINNFVDAPIIVNTTSGEFYKQPMFYCLGHFSKFVPRDSIRIQSNNFDDEVPAIAFKRPDNYVVVVILNTKNEDVSVTIVDKSRGNLLFNLKKKSINTVLYY